MNKLKKIFETCKPIIGMIHFMPLLGYREFAGINQVLRKTLKDLKALEEGGVDGIMVENNYDVPHKVFVEQQTVACISYLIGNIINKTKLPVGISVLWNDYKVALAIAKVYGAKFIRVPVFVDNVKTQYGDIYGNAEDVIRYRKRIRADDVLLFTDIHVKHAELLNKNSIEQSAKKAIQKCSDALIITGKWTADAPDLNDLRRVRNAVGHFPILIGSGTTKENIGSLMQYCDGVIIGTSLKTGTKQKKNVNIKVHTEEIDKKKVIKFVDTFRNCA